MRKGGKEGWNKNRKEGKATATTATTTSDDMPPKVTRNRPRTENNRHRREEPPEALKNEKYINKQYNFIKFKCLFQARAIIRHEGPRCKPHETDTPKAHAPAIKTAKPYRPPHI